MSFIKNERKEAEIVFKKKYKSLGVQSIKYLIDEKEKYEKLIQKEDTVFNHTLFVLLNQKIDTVKMQQQTKQF